MQDIPSATIHLYAKEQVEAEAVSAAAAAEAEAKTSPPWVGWLFFALMGIGVGLILAYYVAFEGSGPWLFVGLGLITASFVVATQWH